MTCTSRTSRSGQLHDVHLEAQIGGVTPEIADARTVNQTLTADGGESDWEPTGLTFDYQRLPDGNPITGATGTTYTLGAADLGARMTVKITGKKIGCDPVQKALAPTATFTWVPKIIPIRGKDRYETAINVSKAGFSSAPIVLVATGSDLPDPLSAAPVVAKQGGPLLLRMKSSSPTAVAKEIKRLKPSMFIAGGASAVSTGIANGLKAATGATADRRGGSDRYETSRLIGADVFAPAKSVYLATGVEFPDALAGAVLAGKTIGTAVPGAAELCSEDHAERDHECGAFQCHLVRWKGCAQQQRLQLEGLQAAE